MRARNDTEALLGLWEAALGQPPEARAQALLGPAPADGEPAPSLGARNARLIGLHTRLFGREIELLSHCPACQAVVQFSADCEALAAQMRPGPAAAAPHRLQAHGHAVEFRLPDSADLAQACAMARDEHGFLQRLLGCCVLACTHEGRRVPVEQLPEPVLDALSERMEALDPGASVSFALACPQCAACWQAPLDVGEMLWRKVRAAAERVLLDIDALARAYGWTEREVLRLSPLRRAAYLQMVAAQG